MAKKLYEETSVQDIAAAIRAKKRWGLLCERYLGAKQSSGTSARKPSETFLPT